MCSQRVGKSQKAGDNNQEDTMFFGSSRILRFKIVDGIILENLVRRG
ncbi:hypothetical protein SAMN00768000_1057 [Sulfobacillus thermosulfidooxidans DSM 9293]|uniref:Uncharacterized protein n=1 Tax=Sulfobacillus thermosulfidooxidans (strain DSM 9293 / VKM B-1269 / AT-1) TaxID=929705 RepID=A0A1W1WAT5_SULTA|nr:hypothetical protein SAMN00768000_1057 [Sulfobacillus thermosulfidooxidans DSM 9293]